MPATLLLTPQTWDLTVDASNNIAVAAEPYALAQDAASAIRLFQGEDYYDTTRGIPVVFLTSSEDLDGATSRLGAAAHLTKPVRADRLLEVVERFARKP